MGKFTAGEWKADKYCVWAGSKFVAATRTGLYSDEQEANAKLIAAAPELLEALQALHDEQNDVPLLNRETQWREAMRMAEAVLKKVRGE